jgi:hypothetical protein
VGLQAAADRRWPDSGVCGHTPTQTTDLIYRFVMDPALPRQSHLRIVQFTVNAYLLLKPHADLMSSTVDMLTRGHLEK